MPLRGRPDRDGHAPSTATSPIRRLRRPANCTGARLSARRIGTAVSSEAAHTMAVVTPTRRRVGALVHAARACAASCARRDSTTARRCSFFFFVGVPCLINTGNYERRVPAGRPSDAYPKPDAAHVGSRLKLISSDRVLRSGK